MQKDATKFQYFDTVGFIQKVVQACGFENLAEEKLIELEDSILMRLHDRLASTIVNTFEEREFVLLDKLLEDHPEMAEIDAVLMIAAELPNLKAKIDEAIDQLFNEFTQESGQISELMKKKQVASQSKWHIS